MASFTWIPFCGELADKLVNYRDRQPELIAFLKKLRDSGLKVTPLEDQDAKGRRFLLEEIDPFTFIGAFNRSTKDRVKIAAEMKKFLGIKSDVPSDFTGIPVLNNQNSWFFSSLAHRKPDDIARLWDVFVAALGERPDESPEFAKAFDRALEVRGTNLNLTTGLFWIRPRQFLSLDSTLREHLDVELPREGLTFKFYKSFLDANRKPDVDLAELSHEAWLAGQTGPVKGPPKPGKNKNVEYWMVGAFWDGTTPPDQTERFLAEGTWVNGYEDRFLDLVRQMKVGDKIAIKAATTQADGLPFDNRKKTISKMIIKARGTIVSNPGDGRSVEVEWEPNPVPRAWYFYTARQTVWHLLPKESEFAQRLIRFAFFDEPQDYDWFLERWWKSEKKNGALGDGELPYGAADVIGDGAFLTLAEVESILRRLRTKKNIVLQGAPGVGKTFVARKLAYALMEARDNARVAAVQFHPSYSYEDFIRGYRPTGEAGKFVLRDGPFMQLCEQAANDPDRVYVMLVDEINRGNLSQVFGELFMLLEADKRGSAHAVTPLYRRSASDKDRKSEDPPAEKFWVPENVYVIGTMNIADRSLALVDFALRRRFSFITLEPQFGAPAYRAWLRERGMNEKLCDRIISRMSALNAVIAADPQLGPAFRVGHSFFCPRGKDFSQLGNEWFEDVVETEIEPLLHEYWHDAPERARSALEDLRA